MADRSTSFRAHARHPVRLPVTTTSHATGGESAADTVDLGLGGARLRMAGPVEVGEALTLSIDSPTRWEPLEVAAQVVWKRPGEAAQLEVGVRFVHATPDGAFAVHKLVTTLVFDA